MILLKKTNIIFILILSVSVGFSQKGEIVSVSDKVGTVIDAEENQFYGLFPDITGFESAQFYEVDGKHYVARIVIVEYSRRKIIRKKYSSREYFEMQIKMDSQPILSDEDRQNIGVNLFFLHTEKILNDIPMGASVSVLQRSGKKIKGELISYEENALNLQTLWGLTKISVWELEKVSYRETIMERPSWIPIVFGFTAVAGFSIAEVWNRQQTPRAEMRWFNRIAGAVAGSFIAPSLYKVVNVTTSPKTTFTLTDFE